MKDKIEDAEEQTFGTLEKGRKTSDEYLFITILFVQLENLHNGIAFYDCVI
jgi:hypothetical protein